VADSGHDAVVHLGADGEVLWRGTRSTALEGPCCVSADPTDGSCWTVDPGRGEVVRLRGDCAELWRGGDFLEPSFVSANSADGSCWVIDEGSREIVHLAKDGRELWRGDGLNAPVWLSVNSGDGSCWVADGQGFDLGEYVDGAVVHLAEDGTELWRSHQFIDPKCVSVNAIDGSCWVVDGNQVFRLVIVRFPDVSPGHWAFDAVNHCFGQGIVSGYPDGLYRPDLPVSRDQMAVYLARALAGGDEYVPARSPGITFWDVPRDHWAAEYVEYCASRGVVLGFPGGLYRPDELVDRGQMAAFIARAVAGGEASVPPTPTEATFPDVPPDHWAARYVEYCAAHDIVRGYDSETYAPSITVTRDQMAVCIGRAF
jgi:hypothetical protein